MLARTLTLAACVFTASSAAEAQSLFNPLSWFQQPAPANCPPGMNCPPNGYYGNQPANCVNGYCPPNQGGYYQAGYPQQNCPGGICPPYQNYNNGGLNGGYNTNYRPVPYTAPAPYTAPNTMPVRYQPLPYNGYGPSVNGPSAPQYRAPVNSVTAPRNLNQNNSPFYP